ncbi:MAG: anti-ECFsigma factor, ChrR [Gemmatimonadetes bacterium]|nr:anti-ECFsigma factor, ChrR [Gemmatimonadota bacterium]
MRFTAATLLLTLAGATASAQADRHTASEPKWGPAPAVFPAGAQMAVMQGNPGKAEPFTVRLRFPSGYTIAPHWHPTDENVTVISGTLRLGMGKKFESNGMLTLNAGGFVSAPANEAHYAQAQGLTVVQVHAIGPFALTYINPADTPRIVGKR